MIDTADFNRTKTSEIDAHIRQISIFWNNISTLESEFCEDSGERLSIIMFFQKELYEKYKHFFIGKFRVFFLEPFTTDALIYYYKQQFNNDAYPFTEEALKELAVLSRGIFRRFKNLIGTCLDNYVSRTISSESTISQLIYLEEKDNQNNRERGNTR